MTVGIVRKETWGHKGVDVFERKVVPRLLERDGAMAITYDPADVYQTGDTHWLLSYAGRFKRGRQITKAITRNDFDTVFLPFQELLTFDPATVDAQIVPYVHDVFPATTTFAGPIPTFLARRYVDNLTRCDLVLCASEQTRSDVAYRTEFDGCTEVIYQGISPPEERHGVDVTHDLLYVGSLLKRKNPGLLNRCFEMATAHGFDCVAVLTGYDDAKDLPGEVHRGVPAERLRELYAGSRFYLHPSKQEGFGRPPVEAQSVGTPPLALDRPINHEVLGPEGEAWSSVATAGDVLDALQMDDERRSTLASAAVENSRRYDWDETVEQIAAALFEE